jgi:hypothetical protein
VVDIVGTTSSTSFTWPATFGGRHHSPPYSIFNDYPWGLHPNGTFSWDSQMKVPNLGLLLSQKLRRSYLLQIKPFWNMQGDYLIFPKKDLSNSVLHSQIKDYLTPTLRGFVVRSQIPNLTPIPSFDHNSCTSGFNEQCENTLNIYTSIHFQWYLGGPIWCLFSLPTKALNIRNSHTSAIPKVGVHLGVIGLHPLHFPQIANPMLGL